jgi:uncharacterized C2H2 Zn-finger protein
MDHKNKAHAQMAQQQQQQYKCNACGMSFPSQNELMDHARKAHPMPAK